MHIVVVQALLIAIYLTESLQTAEPATSWRVATETRPIRNTLLVMIVLLERVINGGATENST